MYTTKKQVLSSPLRYSSATYLHFHEPLQLLVQHAGDAVQNRLSRVVVRNLAQVGEGGREGGREGGTEGRTDGRR